MKSYLCILDVYGQSWNSKSMECGFGSLWIYLATFLWKYSSSLKIYIFLFKFYSGSISRFIVFESIRNSIAWFEEFQLNFGEKWFNVKNKALSLRLRIIFINRMFTHLTIPRLQIHTQLQEEPSLDLWLTFWSSVDFWSNSWPKSNLCFGPTSKQLSQILHIPQDTLVQSMPSSYTKMQSLANKPMSKQS